MNMVGIAAHFYDLTIEVVADTAEIAVQFCLNGRVYQRFPIFGAEYEVYIVFDE
jgi:hypothetical protein